MIEGDTGISRPYGDTRWERGPVRHAQGSPLGGRKFVCGRGRRYSVTNSLNALVAGSTTLTFFWTTKLTEDCINLQGWFGNFYSLTGGGNDTPVAFTIAGAGLEISSNGGQFATSSYTIPLTFNGGQVSATMAGDRPLWIGNDPVPRRFAAGTLIRWRVAITVSATANLIPAMVGGTFATKAFDGFGTAAGDLSTGTGNTGVTMQNCSPYGPAFVVGDRLTNNLPAVGVFGTSIENGTGDDSVISGWCLRALMLGVTPSDVQACTYANYNGAQPGSAFSSWLGNTSYARLFPYFAADALIGSLGINDIVAGQTLLQIQANTQTFLNTFPWLPVLWGSMFPHTGSTDGWTTAANQTPATGESIRVAKCDWDQTTLATLCPNVVQVVLCGALNEVNSSGVLTKDGGIWLPAAVFPSDSLGIHPDDLGHQNAANQVNVAMLASGLQGN